MAFNPDSLAGYVDVPARLAAALERWPEFRAQETAWDTLELDGKSFVAVTVTCWRTIDDPLPAVARSVEPFPGKTPYTRDSEWENAGTSALGRAIGYMLAFPKIAPAEAVRNRMADRQTQQPDTPSTNGDSISPAQIKMLRALKYGGDPTMLTKREASRIIDGLKNPAPPSDETPF
jgi:hypothetical protein